MLLDRSPLRPVAHHDGRLRFNGYVLRRRPLSLWFGGNRVEVPRQSLELLDYLILCRDRIATREELIAHFWSSEHLGADQNLNTCVKRLRKALIGAGGADLIETRSRVGYRFVGDIDASSTPRRPGWTALLPAAFGAAGVAAAAALFISTPNAAEPPPYGKAAVAAVRVAVPPGRNLCDRTLFPMFVDGLTENLVADLQSRSGGEMAFLRVGATDPSFPTPGAPYVLDLAVRQMPDRTIANLTLLSAEDGEVLWARQMSEPTDVENYLKTQERLSSRLARAFSARDS
ncbi:MAG: winged helix-turn-helix domain-containing protein [Caulobacteraceae bacterium]|nr:winged helix-turn-helix domain-containing protein [Caulobacteraceae bacterium]